MGPEQGGRRPGAVPAISVDNVPGAPGIGIKTAALLINEYGDLDTLLARAGEIKQHKRRETLIDFADQIRLSRELVQLDCDTPLPEPIDDLAVREPDGPTLAAFLEAMEFRSLARRVGDGSGAGPAAARRRRRPGAAASCARPPTRAAEPAPSTPRAYVCVRDLETLDAWIARAREAKGIVGLRHRDRRPVVGQRRPVRRVAGHRAGRGLPTSRSATARPRTAWTSSAAADLSQIPLEEAIAAAEAAAGGPDGPEGRPRTASTTWPCCRATGSQVAPIDDTMLISYVLEAGLHGHGMDELSKLHLGHSPIPFKQVAGTGKKRDQLQARRAGPGDLLRRRGRRRHPAALRSVLQPAPGARGPADRLRDAGAPHAAGAGRHGVRRHPGRSRAPAPARPTSSGLRMVELEAEAQSWSAGRSTWAAPSRSATSCSARWACRAARRPPRAPWSTDADVLEDLAAQGHELPRVLLDWRQLSKLKGTYTDNLIAAIAAGTDRVHTSFALAATTTGRLSSSDPNLQNIPIRTEEGRKIRKAFIADAGQRADLRRLQPDRAAPAGPYRRHPAAEGGLRRGPGHPRHDGLGDVRRADRGHARRTCAAGPRRSTSASSTASRPSAWPTSCRSRRTRPGPTSRPTSSASPASGPIWTATKQALVREHGYVTTIFGRKVNIPAIQRQVGGRAAASASGRAINAPIQGAAADVMRRAMIRDAGRAEGRGADGARCCCRCTTNWSSRRRKPRPRPRSPVAREVMERAAEPAVALSVPLAVEARAAANWDEAH